MNLGTYDITIDFSKMFVHNSTSIYFKEGDLNTARVRAKLTMQGKSIDITRCNVVVKIETMTGEKINDVATIVDAVNGIVEIDFKSNTLIEGTNFFELKIVKGESVKESPKLAYRVLDSIEDAGSIEGTNEYPILISLISDANKAIEDANEALELANTIKNNLEEVIDNANSAISNATDATNNANTAATNATSKITEVDNAKNDMTTKVDESIDTMKSEVNAAKNSMVEDINSTKNTVVADVNQAKNDMIEDVNKSKETMIADTNKAIEKMNNDFEALTASQQQDAEVILARDGEESLNTRLKRDLYIGEKSLKQEVLDLAGLKEVQEITYDSTTVPNYNGSMVCKETKNGTVKDLKVKGKSLVNIALDSSKVSLKANPNGWRSQNINHDLFQVGKNYILKVFNISEVESPHMYLLRLHYTDNTVQTVLHGSELINGVREKEFTIQKEINYIQCATNLFTKDFSCYIVIVNSDDSKYVNDYFEGIASVGNGTDKIEVSTRKEDGNLFDGHSYINGGLATRDNTNLMIRDALYRSYVVKRIEPNTKYAVRVKNCGNRFGIATGDNYSETKEFKVTNLKIYSSLDTTGQELELNITSGADDKYLFVYVANNGVFPSNIEIIVNKGDSAIFSEYIQDKKPLLFKDSDGAWKPINELRGVGSYYDSVETDNEQCIYFERVNSQIIQDTNIRLKTSYTNLDYIILPKPKDSIYYGNFAKEVMITNSKFNCYTDNIPNWDSADLLGYFSTAPAKDSIWFGVPKGTTLEQAKEMLIGKTILYPIAQEKKFDVNPLFLEAYEGETAATVDSGVVNAPIEFKITSYITNLVLLNQQRISILENELYKTNLANLTVALNTLDTKLKLEQLTKAPR